MVKVLKRPGRDTLLNVYVKWNKFMTNHASPPYAIFGQALARLRLSAGYTKQQELAKALGVTQQSVSRWEKGLARPRLNAIPALERLVAAKEGELQIAAGYQVEPLLVSAIGAATSHDRQLPLSALHPETFESFCTALLSRIYRSIGGKVQRYGGAGHKQHGIDIFATGSFGTHSFQCKRVNEFGAQKVHTAVADQTYVSDLKVLMLSCVASPKARDAMQAHSGWELWDREDITRRLHELPKTDRVDLIDRYFNGQRLNLLGIEEPGPIQTPEEFFKPFLVSGRFFNHSWMLVGRNDEVSQAVDNVNNTSVVLTCLVGAPGAGKSRVLREVTQRLADSSSLSIRFVSPTEEVKAHHLDRHHDSGENTLIVVDDAHEREDLGTILRHAADPDSRTRLLLSLRPYGKETLRLQAADVSLSGESVRFIDVCQQTKEQAQALAKSVLAECNGPIAAAEEIARATYTTPLVTVLAAQLVSRDDVPIELLGNEEEFRTYVLSCLQDVIAGTLVTGQDVQKLKAVLRVIALLQPIVQDDPELLNLLLKVEKIENVDATRLIGLLGEAGVLFKRGLRSRLAPDLLADEIIRSNYLSADGTANQLVTQVFDAAGADHLKNMFVNLGRLDWRLREGKTDESVLLNSLAPKLHWGENYRNPHVEAVEAVAYYQPRFALDFSKRLIADGHGNASAVCNMVRNAAYTYDHVQEACSLLWAAGRSDKRALHQEPSHGIRILKELAEFKVNKPIEYVEEIIRFALELLERPASLKSANTPFTILEGALGTEIEATSYSRMSISFTRYQLSLERVQDVRNKITEALFKYLREGSPRRAFLAAQTLAQALRGPMHGDESDQSWGREHKNILQCLQLLLSEIQVSPVVLVRLAQSVSWHAFYGGSETAPEAKAILTLLDRDLRTRLIRALIDGWGTETWAPSETVEREEHVAERERLTADLAVAFPKSYEIFDELHSCLNEIHTVAHEGYGAPFLLVNHLLESIPGFATEVLLRNNTGKIGNLAIYVGKALAVAIEKSEAAFVDDYIFRSKNSNEELAQLVEAYARFETSRAYTLEEINLFKRVLQSKDMEVLRYAPNLVRQVGNKYPSLAVELICLMDFEVSSTVVDQMFSYLVGANPFPKTAVGSKRNVLLNKLIALNNLNDFWIHSFLESSIAVDPASVVEFVKERLKEAKRRNEWSYYPLSKTPRGIGLKLMEVDTGSRLMWDLLDWGVKEQNDVSSLRRMGDAISGLNGVYEQNFLDLLLAWMSSGEKAHASLVARVLRNSHHTLIFKYPKFIREIINAAEFIGDVALDEVRSAIAVAASTGMRSGTPGEPFPEDVRMEKYCKEMLATLSRSEPTYELYEGLLKDARYAIERQRKSLYALDEEDE